MAGNRHMGWLACSALAAVLLLTGCMTPRQQAVLARAPRNRIFMPDSGILPLPEGETHVFAEFERTRDHNVCLLRLARDAKLTKRFHAEHDLILVCVSGNAIVMEEETRHAVTPGATIVLPSMTAYTILPNNPQRDFVALFIFSPPFEGRDTFLED